MLHQAASKREGVQGVSGSFVSCSVSSSVDRGQEPSGQMCCRIERTGLCCDVCSAQAGSLAKPEANMTAPEQQELQGQEAVDDEATESDCDQPGSPSALQPSRIAPSCTKQPERQDGTAHGITDGTKENVRGALPAAVR